MAVRHALRQPLFWIGAAVVATVALRLPWLGVPLGRDEGGDAMIALAWHHSGPFPYGNFFLDRPPLLLGLYKLAASAGGTLGIRLLGMAAAVALVALCVLLAVRVAGRRAAPVAAVVATLLASTSALSSVLTPAELLAAVPSAAAVLALLAAFDRERGGIALFALAGVLGMTALLVKQSFADALAAGGVAIVAAAVLGRQPVRIWAARIGAYAAGALAPAAAVAAWAVADPAPSGSILYSLFGFRIAAAHALPPGGAPHRFVARLGWPLLGSGLAIWLVAALAGIMLLRSRPVVRVTLATWLVAGGAGVILGESYWPHYLIALIPVTAAGVAALAVRLPRTGFATVAVAAPLALAVIGVALERGLPHRWESTAPVVGDYLRDRALPRQTVYVLYSRADIIYYSHLGDPFPYDWSLMMRAVPGAQQRLRALLASPGRPTWIVEWQGPRAFSLDSNGATGRLLRREYRAVGRVCGHKVLLARGARAQPPPPDARSCYAAASNEA